MAPIHSSMEKPPNSYIRRWEGGKSVWFDWLLNWISHLLLIICVELEIEGDLDFTCLQNLTHSGVVGGGVRAFGPSRARISLALDLERPCGRHE